MQDEIVHLREAVADRPFRDRCGAEVRLPGFEIRQRRVPLCQVAKGADNARRQFVGKVFAGHRAVHLHPLDDVRPLLLGSRRAHEHGRLLVAETAMAQEVLSIQSRLVGPGKIEL